MKVWLLYSRASLLFTRNRFALARPLLERVVAIDERHFAARLMLASCYEREGKTSDALRLADRAIQDAPTVLAALQWGARLAVAAGEHAQAAQYVRQALTLPELRTEIPVADRTYDALAILLRVLSRVPLLRRRFRSDKVAAELKRLDIGHRAVELQEWKRWAQEYLEWQSGEWPKRREPAVH
jgi:tetratricopeptide (TPR) repeat protein